MSYADWVVVSIIGIVVGIIAAVVAASVLKTIGSI